MQPPDTDPGTTFSQPIRALTTMLVVCVLVAIGGWAIHTMVFDIIRSNPLLNGLIALVFLFGIATCFWQVWILAQSVSWIESFVRQTPGAASAAPPRLLAPLASLLKSRGAGRMTLSSSSAKSILDSVAQRVDEARDITRYLINLLVFLGLLGTFWGLATTVPAVVDTIRNLAPQDGDTGMDVFGKLMTGLESQLGGMGTAFSSSLMGLAGSLVVGLLELFAGHGQNRFYRELEEWLSSITRIGLSGDAEGGDQSAVVQVLDHMAGQMEGLQMLYTQADVAKSVMEDRMADLAAAVNKLAMRLETGPDSATFTRLAEGQERMIKALEGESGADPESRMRLRSIDVQLLRILEELSAGRQETVADLRSDLAALTAAIRQMSRGAAGRG